MAPRKFLFKSTEDQKSWFMTKSNNDFSNWEGKPVGREAKYRWNDLRDIIAQVHNITPQTLVELITPIIRKIVVGYQVRITNEHKKQAKSEIVRMLMDRRRKMKPEPPTEYQTWLQNAVNVYLPRAIQVYRHAATSSQWGKVARSTTRKAKPDAKQSRPTRNETKRGHSSEVEENEEDEEEGEHLKRKLSEQPKRRKLEERENERVYIKISESPEPEQPPKAKGQEKSHGNLNEIPKYSSANHSSIFSQGSHPRHFASSAYSTHPSHSLPIPQNTLTKFNIKIELHNNLSESPFQVFSIATKLIIRSEYLQNNMAEITAESISYEKFMACLKRAPLFFKDDDELGWIQSDVHPLSAAYCRITEEWDFVNALMLLQDLEQPIVLHIVRKLKPLTGTNKFSNPNPSMPSASTESDGEDPIRPEPNGGRQQRFVGNIFEGGWSVSENN